MLQHLLRPRNLFIQNLSKFYASYARKRKTELGPYVVQRPTPEDYECILNLMHGAYYPEEPTCMSLAFKPNEVFDDGTVRALDQGLSLIFKCRCTGDIFAVSVNKKSNPWDADLKDELACKIGCEKSRKLLHFYAHMERAADLWRKCGVQRVFEIQNVFVRRDQRKKGMALRIMEDSRTLAADAGFHLVRVDATSAHTAKLCEKMKMKLVKFIPYCSYIGEDKKPIFRPPEPHVGVKIYVDDDPQSNYKRTPWKVKKRDPDHFVKF